MRIAATDRLARVLAYLPWIAERDGPTLAEVCSRFGVRESQLLADLEVLPFIGLPPYTPDQLIEVTVDDGRVWIHYADMFAQPLRLTPEEGLSLIAAAAAVRKLPSFADGPLMRGLEKVAAVLGVDPDLVETGTAEAAVLEALTQAANDHRTVAMTYYSYGRDQRTDRRVDPWRVFHEAGAWYVMGHCHEALDARVFRVDRIEHLELTEETFPPPEAVAAPSVFSANDDDPRVTLDLAPRARWVTEQYPIDEVTEQPDGSVRVRMAITAPAWFERLMLQLGGDATIVAADTADLETAAVTAARRVLSRYRAAASDQ